MRRTFITLCMIFGITYSSYSQQGYKPTYPLEVGIQLGTAVFLGDLGGQMGIGRPFLRDTDLGAFQPTVGLFGRWNIGTYFTARVDFNYMMLKGDDNWTGRDDFTGTTRPLTGATVLTDDGALVPEVEASWFRWYRQFNFRSRVFEASIAGEIVPYNFELGGGYQGYSVLSPYGFIGLGIFNFRPQGTGPNGEWVDLRDLSTEGQDFVDLNGVSTGRTQYNLTQFNVPIGFGCKWNYNDQWALSLEVNHRLTFTDYIDDVSTNYIDPALFDANFGAGSARAELAKFMARKSVLVDPGNVNGVVSAPDAQRGDPKDNDAFYTITLRFSYFFDPRNAGGSRRYGCPVW